MGRGLEGARANELGHACNEGVTAARFAAMGAAFVNRATKAKASAQTMKLNDLRDNAGARKGRMRVGRGIGVQTTEEAKLRPLCAIKIVNLLYKSGMVLRNKYC